ncbi:MAG: DUF2750 domain-containing protein [Planctomycetota bacterium]|jgi:hypothetical protein
MTATAERPASFCKEVADHGRLWTICSEAGYPAPRDVDGVRVQPFWSSRERAQEIIAHNKHYHDFEPEEVSWFNFIHTWVRDLNANRLRVGLNWRGEHAPSNDLSPEEVVHDVQHYRRQRSWLRRLFGRTEPGSG